MGNMLQIVSYLDQFYTEPFQALKLIRDPLRQRTNRDVMNVSEIFNKS